MHLRIVAHPRTLATAGGQRALQLDARKDAPGEGVGETKRRVRVPAAQSCLAAWAAWLTAPRFERLQPLVETAAAKYMGASSDGRLFDQVLADWALENA